MGVIRCVAKLLLRVTFIFLLVTFTPGLPPYVSFSEFQVSPSISLEGPLSVNTLLNNAEKLYVGKVHGPEAFEDYKGELYTTLHGGTLVKFSNNKVVPVVKFGESCEGFWDENKCGRPLGMKLGPDGMLYVADAYSGLYRVDLNSYEKTQLVSNKESIKGKINKLPNSVDISDDGTIYWTTSSCNFELRDGVFDMLADGSGRLLRYNPKTNTNDVLIEDLHFANGVALSAKEDFVLVAETARSRIHRYYLKGSKKGTSDIFIDGLPGLPDNLKSDGQGGFLVPLVLLRDKNNPIIFQTLGPFPLIRKFVARILALFEMSFEQIDKIYPNYYAKRMVHWIGHFETVHGIGPKGFIILQLDENGKIKHSYHCTDGTLNGISEAHWFNGAFYLGSPYNTYVGRVKLSFADPQQIPQQHKFKQGKPQQEQKAHQQQTKSTSQPTKQEKPPAQQTQPPVQQKKTPPVQQTQPPVQQQKTPPVQQTQPPVQQQKTPTPQQQGQQKSSPPPPPPPQQQQQQQKPPSPPPQQQQQKSPPPQQQTQKSPQPQQKQQEKSPPISQQQQQKSKP